MSNIYRKEFEVGEIGYQLDIIPAGTSQLSDIAYVTIDDRAMDLTSEWTAQFDDDLPFGITQADSINIEFDFLYLPIELQNLLINSLVNTTYSITANGTTLSKDIYLSNTYILRCNFGGASYTDIYYGTQKRSVEHTPINRLYWGKNGLYGNTGNVFSYYIDAIEIKDLVFKIYR